MDHILDLCDDWLLVFASSEFESNTKEKVFMFRRDLNRLYSVLNITHILGQFSHEVTTKLISAMDSVKRRFNGKKVLHLDFFLG